MDRSWLQNLFCGPSKPQPDNTQTLADKGEAEAQFSLGLSFANGDGTPPDYAEAARWYLKAANQNHAPAQFALGILCADGLGVPRDEAAAVMWIRRAAQQGHAAAQHHLGLRHRRASFEGLPEDALESNLEAYKWLRLAASQGYRGSDAEFESIALAMTREQVTEGNHRAAAFTAVCSNPIPA